MGGKIYLTFSTAQGKDSHEFEWQVRDTPLASRWMGAMKEALECPRRIREQRFCGWATSDADLIRLAASINESVEVINAHFGSRYQIAERASFGMPQPTLNQLHHHFELLMGQSWRPSEFLRDIPIGVLLAVRRLNDFVHDYESAVAASFAPAPGRIPLRFFQAQLVPYPQIELTAEELSTFTFERERGDITTSYCQLGKTWEEVFYDHDNHIELQNISPLRFLASSFVCWFTKVTPEEAAEKRRQIQEFMVLTSRKKGQDTDPEDFRHALGHGVYANLPSDSLLRRFSDLERVEFMREHGNISAIRLVKGAQEIMRTFPKADSYLGQEELPAQVVAEITARTARKSGVKFGEERAAAAKTKSKKIEPKN